MSSQAVTAVRVTQAPATPQSDIMESVIIKGDLSKLTPNERSAYYIKVCESVGLNPLTKPFEYITLNNKLTLYALRACTDQLRSIYEVSVDELAESEREGVYIVTAKLRNGQGRTDMAKGAVTISGLKGDALANAMMKAETKAKRRATLSLCGLGFLDETEIEAIPAANQAQATLPKKDSRPVYSKLQMEIDTAQSYEGLKAWATAARERIDILPEDWRNILRLRYQEKLVDLQMQENTARLPATSKADPLAIPATLKREPSSAPNPADDITAWLRWLDGKLGTIPVGGDLETMWNDEISPVVEQLFPPDQEDAMALYRKHEARIAP